MLAEYINTLSLCFEVSIDSNHIHTKLYPNTFKVPGHKCDVEDESQVFMMIQM